MKYSYMYVYTRMIFAAVLSPAIKIFHRHLGPNLLIFAVKVSPTFYGDFMTYHRHFTAKKHRPWWFLAKTRCACCTSTRKSLWSYCLFNCWPSIQVRVIKLIISPWFTTLNETSALNAEPFKCSAFISVCCQLYCILKNNPPVQQ